MIVDMLEMWSWSPSIIDIIWSSWGIDDWDGGVWEGLGSKGRGDGALASGCWEKLGAEEHLLVGAKRVRVLDSFFGALETFFFAFSTDEWTMLLCKEWMEFRPWQGRTIPFLGGWIPLRSRIFMIRLQNGRHVLAVDRLSVFPKIWKMWA